MPKGLLFDMDGVLVDSTPIHAEAFRQVLGAAGVDDFEYAPYAGMRTLDVFNDVFAKRGRALGQDEIAGMVAAKTELATLRMKARNPVFPHAVEVLERLSARFRLGLVSSSSEGRVRGFIEVNQLGRTFQAVVHGGDVTRAKPAPDAYQRGRPPAGSGVRRLSGAGRCRCR